MQSGFYWTKYYKDDDWSVGYRDDSDTLQWQIIGSDELFSDDQLIIGKQIDEANSIGDPCQEDCCNKPDIFCPEHKCLLPEFCTECETRECKNCKENCH